MDFVAAFLKSRLRLLAYGPVSPAVPESTSQHCNTMTSSMHGLTVNILKTFSAYLFSITIFCFRVPG
jgi:hypothetical protein